MYPSQRLLMGPGPSLVHPRVTQAMTSPVLGHLDPQFIQIMDELKALLQKTFQTRNYFTIALSGTGMSGMEAAFANLVERGDKVLVCTKGFFGMRMKMLAAKMGAEVVTIEAPWGSVFTPAQIEEALKKNSYVKVVAIVHAETSTGVLQPMKGIGEIVHKAGAMLLMDCVTSLGGAEVAIDEWSVDVAYSGTQKCLSCPPGLSPFTISDRTMEYIRKRKSPVSSFYLDAIELEKYWCGEKRAYHHTAPAPMYYALLEGLTLVHEEGLAKRYKRHQLNGNAMRAGLAALGFTFLAQPENQLAHLITALLPAGVDDAIARKQLLNDYDAEIGGGFGELLGKMWRVGVMGESSERKHVIRLLSSIEAVLAKNKWGDKIGAGVRAAEEYYNTHTK
ncbi:MAG TPA: alanine--glyoxylate aminotransferase family protein [Candidatus Kapabacteria bacterium]|nr:alanine--glyoxylate aminotransferase family protein [Candidatus Kapabacteria bacterium]